jgi:hypothetical protein
VDEVLNHWNVRLRSATGLTRSFVVMKFKFNVNVQPPLVMRAAEENLTVFDIGRTIPSDALICLHECTVFELTASGC